MSKEMGNNKSKLEFFKLYFASKSLHVVCLFGTLFVNLFRVAHLYFSAPEMCNLCKPRFKKDQNKHIEVAAYSFPKYFVS